MNREQKGAACMQAQEKRNRPQLAHAQRGKMAISLGFYIGVGMLLLLVVGVFLIAPPAKPLINQHANPTPATPLPAQVLASPGSNLYHNSALCPYAHRDAKPLSTAEALRHGLVPCPYCIGNSSARLTPTVISPHP